MGIDPGIEKILRGSPVDELEYGFVIDCLKNYSNPRVKLNHLLKIGALIRIKKGIYLLGEKFLRIPYCLELLANMIYGPSYVSLEWACQYWGLIPEKVNTITSITTKRSKQFRTPVGTFTYEHMNIASFSLGITLIQFSHYQKALVATPEKALMDLLVFRRGYFTSLKDMEVTLFEDLRIDEDVMMNFDLSLIETLYDAHPHSAIDYFIRILKKKKRNL